MTRHNYELACLLTMESSNTYSYMFHTPNVSLAELHAQAMELPLLTQKTTGEKEEELTDLREILTKAKQEHRIDGVVVGALFSQYQRERVEKIAEEIGLVVHAPLWHKNQAQEMKELLTEGFEIMLSAIAADGLDDSWLGRIITVSDVEKLEALEAKNGLNVAGEGGEFESFVLDCPLFTKRVVIDEGDIVKEENSTHNYFYTIKKARLEDK